MGTNLRSRQARRKYCIYPFNGCISLAPFDASIIGDQQIAPMTLLPWTCAILLWMLPLITLFFFIFFILSHTKKLIFSLVKGICDWHYVAAPPKSDYFKNRSDNGWQSVSSRTAAYGNLLAWQGAKCKRPSCRIIIQHGASPRTHHILVTESTK